METGHQVMIPIPTSRGREETDAVLSKYAPWFYAFRFTNGAVTEPQSAEADKIHSARAELLFPFLDGYFEGRWSKSRCLDIACHQGWFASQVALRGAKEVVGVDVRAEHIAMASEIKGLGNLCNLSLSQGDLFDLDSKNLGSFDLTLFLGVLYHLDNPLAALRGVRSLTKGLCAIETQVARPVPEMEFLWGSDTKPRTGPAIALVPSAPAHVEGERPVVLVPTLQALYEMLYAVGFDRLYLAVPRRDFYFQYPNLDRVIVFAQVL